ncbi:DUF2304 domain-containing protein [Candidatus Albibeggiatoa sp. nov. NOAA]|uniref:DUF2304 domain-containing protein n=1 Tax=Candidatus Albibeggiatoa sp. nov. NOAA TaxID=3162724 RepID=UPI0032F8D6F3|nr:DUF2304 domain-containing protein [Thiotrichaceae bacterium]
MYTLSYHITSALLGLSIAGIILFLIRRDHLHTRHALWWLWIAFIILILGIFPRIIDILGGFLGINYPPTLIFVLGIGMLLVKVLGVDIHQSELERRQRRITQRLALLEEENRTNAKLVKQLQSALDKTKE